MSSGQTINATVSTKCIERKLEKVNKILSHWPSQTIMGKTKPAEMTFDHSDSAVYLNWG
jgi:hypothetical protein